MRSLVDARAKDGQSSMMDSTLRSLLSRIETLPCEIFAREARAALLLELLQEELAHQERPRTALIHALAEAVLLYAARAANGEPRASDALDAMKDARIAKAIALMQSDLAKAWTVDELAKAVGLSRPVFARRFLLFAGISPGRFLTNARMRRATELLRTSDAGLAEIATEVGYVSEFAFSRAFKRYQGVPPGVFRRAMPPTAMASARLAA
jgi:transcriptional regulator GlxA family with amidase domain